MEVLERTVDQENTTHTKYLCFFEKENERFDIYLTFPFIPHSIHPNVKHQTNAKFSVSD